MKAMLYRRKLSPGILDGLVSRCTSPIGGSTGHIAHQALPPSIKLKGSSGHHSVQIAREAR
ncbi:MAG: hypothetical protein Q8P59_05490, partial [Dehalococcoidia bacterium]|nr:hypothetical protein [Dehalococcoidia bacterium]